MSCDLADWRPAIMGSSDWCEEMTVAWRWAFQSSNLAAIRRRMRTEKPMAQMSGRVSNHFQFEATGLGLGAVGGAADIGLGAGISAAAGGCGADGGSMFMGSAVRGNSAVEITGVAMG